MVDCFHKVQVRLGWVYLKIAYINTDDFGSAPIQNILDIFLMAHLALRLKKLSKV
jgi:hypothetical protein